MGGNFAPRPSHGPHKMRECLPMALLLRNRLKYALTYNEVKMITMRRLIKVDGKIRTDTTYPIGFQDVVTVNDPAGKALAYYRLMYDTKGRFVPHRISKEEAAYKLCRIRKVFLGPGSIPYAVTHDGRTIRYVHPEVRPHDSVLFDLNEGKMATNMQEDDPWIKFTPGNVCMITGGNNVGRVGTIVDRERHPGSVEVVHVKDPRNQTFATRVDNVFVIGKATPWVSLPKGEGVKMTIIEERKKKLEKQASAKGH
eukprot:CAMPEP_0113846140 /NCGR_PEP_ID=MMETSP0372-20130328/1142_1 /TAXON_ID=340204 /ORGANISM="Lankesteria abbotti" /LENGTH=253 /DNA_ID=CAMNT_0000815251 /DNA_START=1 /DNA_END=762 /DNA_ORIENTATION=+ /assembly_acc=CAM_ASM_000359